MTEAQPDVSQTLAERIAAELERRILSDELPAETRLPAERQLAAELGTNRNTLREATRLLEQRGLVRVRHGQGVTVQDFRRTAPMDVIAPFLRHGRSVGERAAIVADLLNLRAEVLGTVATLAAERATADDLARLDALAAAQRDAFDRDDRVALMRGDLAWLDALVDAARSLTTRWLANSLFAVYGGLAERFPGLWRLEPTYPDHLAALGDALAARDGARARDTLRAYHRRNDARVLALLAPAIAQIDWDAPTAGPSPASPDPARSGGDS